MSTETRRCPECGEGVLVDIKYWEGSDPDEIGEPVQLGDTRQLEAYSCGHEVVGPSLEEVASGNDELQVEHRQSQDTADAPDSL